jgi:ABC-2 type transport system permease protein
MHTLLVLLRKDFANFFNNKAAVSLTFIVPFAMIYVFGQVFGVNRTDRGPTDIPLAVVNASNQPGAAKLVAALKSEKTFKVITEFYPAQGAPRPLAETDLRALMRDNVFRFAVVIPEDFVSAEALGLHLKIYSNPRNEIETQMVNGMLQKTIFTTVPEVLGHSLQARASAKIGSEELATFNRTLADNIAKAFGGNADSILKDITAGDFGLSQANTSPSTSASSTAASDLLSQLVRIETEQVAGKEVKSPAATRIVSGFAIQFLLFALSSSAAALFYERDRGIFQRILAGPVSRSQILWSKFLYGTSLGLLQLVVLFVGGRILYGIDIEQHVGGLIIVSIAVAATCTAFGMLLASIATTMEAASGLATFIILLMCSVGGAWFPVSMMPQVIQKLSKLTIVYWSMEGFDKVLWLDATFAELMPTLGILAVTTVGVMTVAVWRFNRSNLFE